MPIINRVAAMQDEVAVWRRDMHANPEILYEVHRTAGLVAEKLKAFGCDEVVPGIGVTGVVGVIKGRKSASGKVIGLRADMDALPMTETTGTCLRLQDARPDARMRPRWAHRHAAWRCQVSLRNAQFRWRRDRHIPAGRRRRRRRQGDGRCWNDGPLEYPRGLRHAQHAGHSRRVILRCVRARCLPPAIAFTSEVNGKGGHASRPHECIDPVLVASHIVMGLHSIVSRNVDPLEFGRHIHLHVARGRGRKRHPREGRAQGDGAFADSQGAQPHRAPRGGGGRGDGETAWRYRCCNLHPRLPRHGEPRAANRVCCRGCWRRLPAPTRSTPTPYR